VGFPRDIDIRSGAFVLFAFVVVIVFATFSAIGIACRIFGDGAACLAATPEALGAFRSLIENVLAILLALMAGARPPNGKPPPEGGGSGRVSGE
jgi:hypothetical protein